MRWRELFDEIRVPYVDRGANVGRDNINIRCPFCGDRDPSHHMGVSEVQPGYFCYRSSESHSGKSVPWLLKALNVPPGEIDRLIAKYGGKEGRQRREPPPPSSSPSDSAWRRWRESKPASEADFILAYLRGRGFDAPQRICQRFDLRYFEVGKWAQRLCMPIYQRGQLIGWTGRALQGHLSPRYLTESKNVEFTVYAPIHLPTNDDETRLVITEGPMDALKLAAYSSDALYRIVALTGTYLNSPRIEALIDLVGSSCRNILICLDKDMPLAHSLKIRNTLESFFRRAHIRRAALPDYAEDPAEIVPTEIAGWLNAQFDLRK